MYTNDHRHHVLLFDAGCAYAHNEFEFGTWRQWWNTYLGVEQGNKWMEAYKDMWGVDEPREEWEDRNRLYSLVYTLNAAAAHCWVKDRER